MNQTFLRVVLLVVIVVSIVLAALNRELINLDTIQQWVDQAGWWAPIVFMLIYIIATVLFLPGSILTLSGGVLFGPVMGTFYNLTGATIGAALSFLIARYLAADMVSARSGGRLKQLINGVEAEGWRFVAFVRLVPLFPFNLLNYALGLTRIRFIEYLLASYVFMLPGAIAYTYLGFAGREAASGSEDTIRTILIALALLSVVVFLPRFVAAVRRGPSIDVAELKRRLDNGQTMVLDVRTEKEFHDLGHIDSALNIPLDKLEQRIDEIAPYVGRSISIICKTDKRSAKAANLLLKHGFEDVRVVRGGMTDWNKIITASPSIPVE